MKHSRWKPAAACYLGILILSSIPPGGIPSGGFFGLDKIAHVIIYTVFGFFLDRLRWRFHHAWLLGAALAAIDEAYQHVISGRTAEYGDWLADGIGLALGLALGAALRR